jgi:hypothetical protein
MYALHSLTLPLRPEREKPERGSFSSKAAYLSERNAATEEFRNVRPFHRSTGSLRFLDATQNEASR